MTKYIARKDNPPAFKVGDIVEAENELLPIYKDMLEKYDGDLEVGQNANDEDGKIIEGTALNDGAKHEEVGNLSRDDLKARADALGIDYAANISTAKLVELVVAKEAENESDDDNDKDDD